MDTSRSKGQPKSPTTSHDLHTFNAQLQFACATGEIPDWICFDPTTRGISDRFLLHRLATFAATTGLTAAMALGQLHSVSAANRGELWFVIHDICLPAYRSIGVAFPCAEVNIANGLDRGFAVLQTPSSPRMSSSFPPIAFPVLKAPRCKAKMRQIIGRQRGTPAASLSKGRAADCRVVRLEWR
jgi:hypothetical protein